MCLQEIAFTICVATTKAGRECSVSAQQEVEILDFFSFDTFPLLTLQRNWQFPTFEHFIFYFLRFFLSFG